MANTLKFGNGEWYGKKDTILAYNDLNSNYKPLPFDFSRASKATVINKDGLIEEVGSGQPRIDYKDDSKGALKLEPSRTNLFTYSEPTTNEGTSGGVTYESFNWGLGFTNCVRYGDNSEIRYRYGANVSATTQYTISAFVIMDDLSEPLVGVNIVTGDFAFVAGGVIGGVANENIYYGNNIYRVSTTLTSGSNTSNNGIIKYTQQSSKGFRVVGFQVELGSNSTSLINTQGSAVTRLADSCSQTTPSGVIGQTEGTLLVDFNFDGDISGNRSVATLSSGGSADFIASFIFNNLFYARIRANNGSLYDVTKSNLTSGNHKIAIAYASNDLTFYLDGNIVGQNTSASVSFGSELSTIKIGESTGGTAELGGLVSKTLLYNTRLSNSELEALTQV